MIILRILVVFEKWLGFLKGSGEWYMISDVLEGKEGRRNQKFEIIVEIGRWSGKRVLPHVICQDVRSKSCFHCYISERDCMSRGFLVFLHWKNK
jgi:hypothetical protein